jgi:polyphosphate kinase
MKSLLNLTDNENIIAGGRYHNKRDFMSFPDFDRKELVFKSCPPLEHPALRRSKLMFEQIQEKDILLHYPYHDFGYIIDLLREATLDPLVTRIRITLYRVAKESRIVAALVNAARNGKRVMVVIEIQARFDEQVNIQAGDRLQEAGCKIIFGVPGLKVHTKMLLITRRVGEKTVRYAHIGTGNFHERNAKVYTDLALITANQSIGKEVKKVFEMTEKNYMRPVYKHLLVSPINSRRRLEAMLQNEVNNAKEGKEAWIKLKLNNLVDNKMIKRLYKASEAGVKIQLIVRGVCALVPGVPGFSENIEVVSIVGRYLEHARILMFCNAGKTLYYLTSADIMTRNLDYRIEVGVPIYDAEVQQSLARVFDLQWSDNVNARLIDKGLNNFYRTAHPGEASMNSQEEFYNLYKGQA